MYNCHPPELMEREGGQTLLILCERAIIEVVGMYFSLTRSGAHVLYPQPVCINKWLYHLYIYGL